MSGLIVDRGQVAFSLGAGPVRAAAPSALRDQVRAAVALGRRARLGPVHVSVSRGGLGQPERETPAGNAWRYIVIHHSATPSGNAASFAVTHRRNKWDGLAYHFVINNGKGNPDGLLEISPRWLEQKHGAHAGGVPGVSDPEVRNGFNEFGIGICLVGSFQRSEPTEKQLETLALLIGELRDEFDIPAENVLGHGSVKSTACPGAAFPWARLFALMELPAPRRHRHPVPQTTERCPWCRLKEGEK
jgi:N-acetyl-anhydromuramyl-L-alanine amidase AmpD